MLKDSADAKAFLVGLLEALNSADAASDFLLGLVHLSLKSHGAVAASLVRLTRDSRLELVGAYGYTSTQLSALNASIWSNLPSAVAIREGKDFQFPQQDNREYPTFPDELFKDNPLIGDFYLSIPTLRSKTPIGCLNIEIDSMQQQNQLNSEELSLLRLVSHAALNRFQSEDHYLPNGDSQELINPSEIRRRLSARQVEILRQIVDGRTNYQIARSLNLSESAIKQETVKIFKQLGVRKRLEAGQLATELGLFDAQEVASSESSKKLNW